MIMSALCALVGLVGMVGGRVAFGQWFNHVSWYCGLWALSLVLYGLGLISYYPMVGSAWAYVWIAWFAFVVGALTPLLGRLATRRPASSPPSPASATAATRRLKWAIVILVCLASTSLVQQLIGLVREFGSLTNALITSANTRYLLRVSGELTGWIPYIDAFSVAAAALGGVYTARRGRIDAVGLLPLLIVGLQGVSTMGRMGIGVALVLYWSALAHTPHSRLRLSRSAWAAAPALVVGAAAFLFVSSIRGLGPAFPGESTTLESLRRYAPFIPSLYTNFSAPPVAFSEYLKSGAERAVPGTFAFAPLVRALSYLGLTPHLSYYQVDFYTPVATNTATYLKEVYADFGATGIALFPYLLAASMTVLIRRIRATGGLPATVALAHLYVIVLFSWNYNVMLLGYWFISFVVALVTAFLLDHTARPRSVLAYQPTWVGDRPDPA